MSCSLMRDHLSVAANHAEEQESDEYSDLIDDFDSVVSALGAPLLAHALERRDIAFSTKTPDQVVIFGEVCDEGEGTLISALGDHNPGNPRIGTIPITDGTLVKDVLCLREPTVSLGEKFFYLSDLWSLQIRCLDNMIRNERARDRLKSMKYKLPLVRNPRDNSWSRIATEFKPKYRSGVTPHNEITADEIRPPTGHREGRTYNAQCLPDYDANGPVFANHTRRVCQQFIYDIDGSLVPPWKIAEVLRPGTLITAKVRRMSVVYKAESGVKGKRLQLQLQSVRVFKTSSAPPHILRKHSGFTRPGSSGYRGRISKRQEAMRNVQYLHELD